MPGLKAMTSVKPHVPVPGCLAPPGVRLANKRFQSLGERFTHRQPALRSVRLRKSLLNLPSRPGTLNQTTALFYARTK